MANEWSVGYIFLNALSWNVNVCAAITHRSKKNLTCAFLHGLDTEEIEELCNRLHQCEQVHQIPTLIPTILLEFRIDMAASGTERVFYSIKKIEVETGLDPQWKIRGEELERNPSVDLNFERIMRDLTSISVRLSHYAFICKAHMKLPELLDHINGGILTRESDSESYPEMVTAELFLRTNNAHIRAYLEGIMVRVEALQARVQAQKDTVS